MINYIRFTWQLLTLCASLVLSGILIVSYTTVDLKVETYLVSLLSVTVITYLTYLIMAAGIRKSGKEGMVLLMGGIGLKFLLYLLYILIFWMVTKNLTKPFIITFFALYLNFTFFLGGHLFKLLKNK